MAALFAVALALRMILLLVLAPHEAAAGQSTWDFGHEAACLGEALYQGRGLADPWSLGTGASGWLTPPYPALIAALMWAFDGVNPSMAFALFSLQALFSAATCVLLTRLGQNLGAARAGWWGAVIFALYPPALWNAVSVVWDTTFVAFGTVACLVVATRKGAFESTRATLGAGLCWGALALVNPAPLSLLPAVFVYIAMSSGSVGARAGRSALFAFALLAVCAPWMLRNARVLGTANLRPNFGVELRLGNNPEANGHPVPFKFHPSHVASELALYRDLGERAYAADCGARATQWISEHPGDFLVLCLRRVQYFWIGDLPLFDQRSSAASRAGFDPNSWAKFLSFAVLGVLGWIGALRWGPGLRERRLLLLALLGFGLAYYVTHVSERYRFPIDPLLALLSASALLRIFSKGRAEPEAQ